MGMIYRRIFFYSLVLLFFILLPLILLYAFGYRWDFNTNTLTRTGLVTLRTVPEGAEVALNGYLLNKKTPANINLLPGIYEIDVNLKGYWPYSKKVEVRADRVLRLEHVILFHKSPKFRSLSLPEKTEAFFLSPNGKYALFLARQDKEYLFYLLRTGDKNARPLNAPALPDSLHVEKLEIRWTTDEEAAVLSDGNLFYVLFPKRPRTSYFLKEALNYEPSLVKTSRRRPAVIYFLRNGQVIQFDLRRKIQTPTLLEGVSDFQPTSFGFYWLKKDSNDVFQSDDEGKGTRRLTHFKNFQHNYPLAWDSSNKTFLSFQKEKWATRDVAGNFYVLDPPFYQPAVKGFRFSPSGDKIIYWTPYELWLLEEDLPAEGAEGGSRKFKRQLIFESEVPIHSAFWSSEENYIYFLTHRKLYSLELPATGGINLYPLYVSNTPFPPHGWAVDEDKEIFYCMKDIKEKKQLRALHLSVGFFDPLVSQVKEQVDSIKERLQATPFLPNTKKEEN